MYHSFKRGIVRLGNRRMSNRKRGCRGLSDGRSGFGIALSCFFGRLFKHRLQIGHRRLKSVARLQQSVSRRSIVLFKDLHQVNLLMQHKEQVGEKCLKVSSISLVLTAARMLRNITT